MFIFGAVLREGSGRDHHNSWRDDQTFRNTCSNGDRGHCAASCLVEGASPPALNPCEPAGVTSSEVDFIDSAFEPDLVRLHPMRCNRKQMGSKAESWRSTSELVTPAGSHGFKVGSTLRARILCAAKCMLDAHGVR